MFSHLLETLAMRAYSFFKLPVLFFIGPSIEALDDRRCVVKIPLNWRTRNHLGSMHIAVLTAGADCVGGVMAMRSIRQLRASVSVVFKDFKAVFLKRPEGDTHFTCLAGEQIRDLVRRTVETGERVELPIQVTATVPAKLGDEPVARFEMTMSIKRR